MSTQLRKIDFYKSVYKLTDLPFKGIPEIAVIGRSNVGKSSFINRTTNRKSLAHTSSTPGRTKEFNLFETSLKTDGKDIACYLVDLPGYGYAKFSKKKRQVLNAMIVEYLSMRSELKVVCLLNDCRRMPERDELALRELVFESGKHLLVVLTKIDKVKKTARPKAISKVAGEFGLEPQDVLVTGDKMPAHNFWERIMPFLCD